MKPCRALLVWFGLLWSVCVSAQTDVRGLLQMVDYLGVDYPGAVEDGRIIHAAEYLEMQEFSASIIQRIEELPHTGASDDLQRLAQQLSGLVEQKASSELIAETTQGMRQLLMANYAVEMVPRYAPDLQEATALYQQYCSGCHGDNFAGDGPGGAQMEPSPTNFHDLDRARQRSLFGLYNTVTLGVDGTGMAGFPQFSDHQRWSLALLVGQVAGSVYASEGAQAWQNAEIDLVDAVVTTPAELSKERADGEALIFWTRHNIAQLYARQAEAMDLGLPILKQSREAYLAGDLHTAKVLAVQAYLEGFELSEAALSHVTPELTRRTETALMAYRQALVEAGHEELVERRYTEAVMLLKEARETLDNSELSPNVAFSSALIILLREGLEAILVLMAMSMFLNKTGRGDAMKYLHIGWISALILGAITWVVSAKVIAISGAGRELTEGVTALVAAIILFYVGFWMHNQASAKAWNEYLEGQMKTMLSGGTLWAVCGVSFLAVYREVFETILFYQALFAQGTESVQSNIMAGIAVAAVLLAVVALLVRRFSMKLPLAQFFSISAILMVVLAVIFAGKGVAALQEAGYLAMSLLDLPKVMWVGFYPTWQGALTQAAVLALAIILFWRERRRS